MGVTRALVKLTVGSTFLLTALACPSSVMAAGALLLSEDSLKLLMTAISSVSAGNVANALDALTQGKDPNSVSLQNEDLTKAVGKALAAVITLLAKQHRGDTRHKLEKIAAQAKDNWVSLAKQEFSKERYPELKEERLPEALIPTQTSLTQETILTIEEWKNIFVRLNMAACSGGGFTLPSEVYQQVAELLHTTFPKALRETLKEDFAKDGKAFAGLTIQLLMAMRAELGKLPESQKENFNLVLNRFRHIEIQLQGTAAEQQAAFSEISQQIYSGFAEVCQQLGVLETNITQLLHSLEEAISEIGSDVKEIKETVFQINQVVSIVELDDDNSYQKGNFALQQPKESLFLYDCLNQFIRFLYPSFAIYSFIIWKIGQPSAELSVRIIVLSLSFYPIYRSSVWLTIRYVMSALGGIPQYEFHKLIVDELKLSSDFKTVANASSCAYNLLHKKATLTFRQELSFFNGCVHVLYMTSCMSIAAIAYSCLFQIKEIWLWSLIFCLTLVSGLLLDRFQADMRECFFIKSNKSEYIKLLKNFNS